jgi:hypothetical protein
MKKLVSSFAVILMLTLFASLAMAFGPNPKDSNGFKLQQGQASAITCTTIAAGRASTATVNVSQSPYLSWKAFDSSGAGVVVKKSYNAASGYMPSTGETSLAIGPAVKTAVFTRYTGASAINLCYEK